MSENVLVLGATGTIGRSATVELLARGHRVVAVARNAERLRGLASQVDGADRLAVIARSVARELDAGLLVQALRDRPRRITAVVAALRGSLARGRLLDRSGSDLLRALDDDVVTNFIAAKYLLPLLAESGRGVYVIVGGPMASCAWAGYGQVSIAAAALQMLANVVREEAKDLPVVIQQLQVGTPVRSAANADCACPEWIGADDVARRIATLIEQRSERIPIVQIDARDGPGRLRAPSPFPEQP